MGKKKEDANPAGAEQPKQGESGLVTEAAPDFKADKAAGKKAGPSTGSGQASSGRSGMITIEDVKV